MITPIYAALLGLLLIVLSVNVIKGRAKFRAALGDADNVEMKRRIRAQANLAEYAPMFLIMLGLAEYGGLPGYAVHLFGLIFVAGRCSHAYSLLRHEQYDNGTLVAGLRWRIGGMIPTFASIGLLAVILLWQSIV